MGSSTLASARMFLVGMDEEYVLNEFDDIKRCLRKCEENLMEYQKQEYVIPAKLNTLRNHIDYNSKMFDMINVLEREWVEIQRRYVDFRRQTMN